MSDLSYKGRDLFGNYVVHVATVDPRDRFDLLFSSAREAREFVATHYADAKGTLYPNRVGETALPT